MKPLLASLAALGAFRLAALAMVGAATLGVVGFLAMHHANEHFALLYAELDLREAGQIADALERQHIAHQVGANGSEILVPADQVSRARLLLAKDQLPSGGSIGYEIFDRGDGFTANQFQQTMNQLRALEGELGRTIAGISGVRAARVHLVLARREPFARERQEAQASVMLTTAGAGRLDRESVRAIVNLVAAAVPGLRPGTISVVDNRGQLLARPGDPANPAATALTTEDLRRSMEQRMRTGVEELLERTLGPGRVRAEVTLDADFDRITESQEKYDPDGQVTRSSQTSTDTSHTTEANTNVSVQNNLPNADAGATPAGTQDQKQDETTNYEIGKTVRSSVHDQAQIRRLSLAVMVDGTQQRGPDGAMIWQPRAPEELDRIGRLVKSAVGFDAKRGDQIEVVTMRFVAEEEPAAVTPPGLLGFGLDKADLLPLAQSGVLGLVAILALLLVLRPMVARLTTLPGGALALAGDAGAAFGDLGVAGGGLAGGRIAGDAGGGMALLTGPGQTGSGQTGSGQSGAGQSGSGQSGESGDDLVNVANVEGQLRASSVRRLTDLVDKHPDESLAIVRAWMQQETA